MHGENITSDNIFLDSNVMVYAYSIDDIAKRTKALTLLGAKNNYISTQVLNEFSNVSLRKLKSTPVEVQVRINELCETCNVYTVNTQTILSAIQIHARYGYTYYDSLIIAAALETSCSILYSEDLQDGQVIDNRLTIINPFKK